jgi:hypothetical protein
MKIEQLLVQHFYLAKQVTLQGIGTFTLSPDFVMPADTDKDIVLPENAVTFQYNPKATEDDALINYIVQQSRKMKPLASADLESYLMLASQFLNIGKPMKIDGIGILEKNQSGEFLFSPGQFINTKTEDATVQLKEKSREDISFSNEARPAAVNKKMLAIVAGVIVVGLIGWAAWYFISNKKTTTPIAETTPEQTAPATTPVLDTVKKDTATLPVTKKPDSVAMLQPAANTPVTGYTFKIVFKVTNNKAIAVDKMNTMIKRGHKVIMYTADSVTYKLAEPFNLPLSDTAKIKDSLNRFYYLGNAKVEMK